MIKTSELPAFVKKSGNTYFIFIKSNFIEIIFKKGIKNIIPVIIRS